MAGSLRKVKAEAEKLEVMDKAAGILAELLYTEKLLSEIKEYRPIMLLVSDRVLQTIRLKVIAVAMCGVVVCSGIYWLAASSSLLWTTAGPRSTS